MFVLGFWLLGLVLLGLQTTLFMVHPLWPASPDFLFILVAYLAYRHDILRSLLVLFPLGMLFDVVSGLFLGMYPAMFLIGYFFLKLLAEKLPVRESLYQVPMIGVSYLVSCWLVYVVMNFVSPGVLVFWSWPLLLLRTALVVLLALPFFRLFDRFSRRLQRGLRITGMRVASGNRFRR